MCQLSTKIKWGVMCLYQPDQLWYFQVEYNRSKKFPTIFFKLENGLDLPFLRQKLLFLDKYYSIFKYTQCCYVVIRYPESGVSHLNMYSVVSIDLYSQILVGDMVSPYFLRGVKNFFLRLYSIGNYLYRSNVGHYAHKHT